MMVFSTATLIGHLLLWADYQALLVLSNTKLASAEPNTITLDNKKEMFFLEPELESNPSSMEYHSGLYHPSDLQAVVHHSKTSLLQSFSKLWVLEPNLKSLLRPFTVKKTLKKHEKQLDTLEKITELDANLKQNHYRTEHNIHGRDLRTLHTNKTPKPDVTKMDVVDYKSQKLDIRDKYHKGPLKSANQTNAKTITKGTKTEHIDNADQNVGSLLDFHYNPEFGSHKKNEKQKASFPYSSDELNNLTKGKDDENPTEDKHFILNHDDTGADHNMFGPSSNSIIPVYKDNTKGIIKKNNTRGDWVGYKKHSPLETLYSLVSFVLNQEYEQVEKQRNFTKKHKEGLEVYDKGIELYNSGCPEDQNLKEEENKKKEKLKDLLMDYDLTGEEDSPSLLISDVDHKISSKHFDTNSSYNIAPISSANSAENVETNESVVKAVLSLSNTDSPKFEKNNLPVNNDLDSSKPSLLEPNEENGPINEKEQGSSGWMVYLIIAASVVVVLVLISLLVVCGVRLNGCQKNRNQNMLEILQHSSGI